MAYPPPTPPIPPPPGPPPIRVRRRAGLSRGPRHPFLAWVIRRRWYLAFLLLFTIGLMGSYVGWTLKDLPDPGHDNVLSNSVVMLDRNGAQIEQTSAGGQFYVKLNLKPGGGDPGMGAPVGHANDPHVAQLGLAPAATLAAEDRDFYGHGAVRPESIVRATVADIRSGAYVEGGSTITQQTVKITLLTPQKSILRKIQEFLLAEGLEARYSKDDILGMYLNRVYYGNGAYGLGAAAKTYFNKDAHELDLREATFLAGLIQAPGLYNPLVNPDLATKRQGYVLDGLVLMGVVSRADADAAKSQPIKITKVNTAFRNNPVPHFTSYVNIQKDEILAQLGLSQQGLKIYTTLDLGLQRAAQSAVTDSLRSLGYEGVNNGMLVAAKPDTGEVVAWVGSADYGNDTIHGSFDMVSMGQRPPGSSFKPYTYEAALRDKVLTPSSILNDSYTNFGGYVPHDYDGQFWGKMTLHKALVESRNVPAVQAGNKVGMSKVISLAREMGITTPDIDPGLSTAIGGGGVPVHGLDQLQGYQVFANLGEKIQLTTISKITDSNDNILWQANPTHTQVLSPAEAYQMTNILKDYPGRWSLGWGDHWAGKSGTQNDESNPGYNTDAWMMGYNSKVVIAGWMGRTQPGGNQGRINTFGVEVGSHMLAQFISKLPGSYRGWYNPPSGLTLCRGDYYLPGTENTCQQSAPSPTPPPIQSPDESPTLTPEPSPTPHKPKPSPPLPTGISPLPTS